MDKITYQAEKAYRMWVDDPYRDALYKEVARIYGISTFEKVILNHGFIVEFIYSKETEDHISKIRTHISEYEETLKERIKKKYPIGFENLSIPARPVSG